MCWRASTRLRLWCEHLGRDERDNDDLVDGVAGIATLRRAAADLDAWSAAGRTGPRPLGRLRAHRPDPVERWAQLWAEPLHRLFVDPDGRPKSLRRAGSF